MVRERGKKVRITSRATTAVAFLARESNEISHRNNWVFIGLASQKESSGRGNDESFSQRSGEKRSRPRFCDKIKVWPIGFAALALVITINNNQ
jgi:hypothetical protein